MAERIRVVPEDLLISGSQVEGHAAEVEAGHAASDARIQAAQAGMVGMSSAAVEAKLAQWQATTAALTARLTDHAEAFTTSGIDYRDADLLNAAAIADVGEQGAETGVSAPRD
jgi:WXG100 family type VII secretion target